MYNLKTQFFRPSSTRPTSPVPPSRPASAAERSTRLPKLSLASFRKPSPSPSARSPVPVTQDGSYIEVLGLKLSEAVSKALTPPPGPAASHEQVSGRRPIPAGRGRELGALIASEIKASRETPHLHRAAIRSLHRPLSVLATNLSTTLLPIISAPDFLKSLAPTPQFPNPNGTQLHAIALATFAGELLETFDELGLGLDAEPRGDGLKAVRDSLVSVVRRVVDPFVASIKNQLMPLVEALETPAASGGKGHNKSLIHPSIAALQVNIPLYARALSRYITTASTYPALATLLICLVWTGLVALSSRPAPLLTPPNSPSLYPKEIKRRGSSATPPSTPPTSRFTLKLPPSRPPSPNGPSMRPSAATDARMLHDLLAQLPHPPADRESTRIAHEAVDDAFEALRALAGLLEVVQSCGLVVEMDADLQLLTEDVQLLIALPVLLRAFVFPVSEGQRERSVAGMLGLEEVQYRRGCLAGFGRADDVAEAVGLRVLDVLKAEGVDGEKAGAVVRWLEKQVGQASQH